MLIIKQQIVNNIPIIIVIQRFQQPQPITITINHRFARLLIITLLQQQMWKRFSNYRSFVSKLRQKSNTLNMLLIKRRQARLQSKTRNRITIPLLIGGVGLLAYFIHQKKNKKSNQMNNMKLKLMRMYPHQTWIIGVGGSPLEGIEEQMPLNSDNNFHDEIMNIRRSHCASLVSQDPQQNEEIQKIRNKMGSSIIIFSPKTFDELTHAIYKCKQYSHKAIVGHYPPPSESLARNNGQSFSVLPFSAMKPVLSKIWEPIDKSNYIILNLSQFCQYKIDKINDVLVADTGSQCRQLNRTLQLQGYQPLFQQFCQDDILYEVIVNNLPLNNNESLINRVRNLSLVSTDGIGFKSSTEVEKFGQIPNLTSLFIGTGGVFAVPAQANIKLYRKPLKRRQKYYYTIQSENLSELVLKLRQIREYMESNRLNYTVKINQDKNKPNKITIQMEKKLQLGEYVGYKQETQSNIKNRDGEIDYIFSIDNKILEKLILNQLDSFSYTANKNLLQVTVNSNPSRNTGEHPNKISQIPSLVSQISLEGGVLVWCKNKQQYETIKAKTDLLEASAQLMKKIVEVREGIDKTYTLYSHPRYENYFVKGFFRKITQVFW